MESNRVFWNLIREDNFTKEGDCKLSGMKCRNENVNCQRCNMPLLFPKEALMLITGEPKEMKKVGKH